MPAGAEASKNAVQKLNFDGGRAVREIEAEETGLNQMGLKNAETKTRLMQDEARKLGPMVTSAERQEIGRAHV